MDHDGPPFDPSDFSSRTASGRTSTSSDPLAMTCGDGSPNGVLVASYHRDEAEVRDGFLIALRAMGLAPPEGIEPETSPGRRAKP